MYNGTYGINVKIRTRVLESDFSIKFKQNFKNSSFVIDVKFYPVKEGPVGKGSGGGGQKRW